MKKTSQLLKPNKKKKQVKEAKEEIVPPAGNVSAVLSLKAFLGALLTYTINPIPSNLFSFTRFFNDSRSEIRRVLVGRLIKAKALKVKLSYLGLFVKTKIDEEGNEIETIEERNFRSEMYEVIHEDELEDVITKAIENLIDEIEQYSKNGSLWKFRQNKKLDINIYSFQSKEVHIFHYPQLLQTNTRV